MWWEILPSGLTIMALYCLGNVGYPVAHYLQYGKPAPPFCEHRIDHEHYRRNAKLDPSGQGCARLCRYFEDVPDLPESEKNKTS